ncbi:MAG: antitoxin [Methyloprofundus sp.]|nr:MAG: antitoxin [Methyloprofundus sp.]
MTPKIGITMSTAKNERITARVSEPVKETLTIAADLVGATLNQFLIQSALEKAENIIEKDKIIRLSNKDAQVFFNALDNPPEANIKLKNAFENYQSKIG